MNSANKALLVMVLLTTMGILGCTETSPQTKAVTRLRQMESRHSKLEEDYRSVSAEATVLRKKLAASLDSFAALEQKYTQLDQQQQQQVETTGKEQTALKLKLTAALAERDAVRTQLLTFSRQLQSIAGKAEQASAPRKGGSVFSTVSMQSGK